MRFLTYKNKSSDLSSCFCYKIADATYCSANFIPELQPLLTSNKGLKNKSSLAISTYKTPFNAPVYHQSTMVGEGLYQLEVQSNKSNDYLLKAGGHCYYISKNSILTPYIKDQIILLGPALILNLAMNNVFCLHASACVFKNKAVVFLAQSGTGKSTIARFISESLNAKRIADDIVPVKIINNQLTLLPCFPQLKLNSKQQYNAENINLKTHFMFIKKDSNKKMLVTSLSPFEALKNIISHTIAARLFNPQHLKNHLEFCQLLSSQNKCYHVGYPHKADSLPSLLEYIDGL